MVDEVAVVVVGVMAVVDVEEVVVIDVVAELAMELLKHAVERQQNCDYHDFSLHNLSTVSAVCQWTVFDDSLVEFSVVLIQAK